MSALLRLPELAKYELLEEIGHGGMATVYRARDRRLGREVAVKLIHRHLRDSSDVAERFAREATAVAMLRHPGIVEVYDVSDLDEAEQYLVVELIRGPTLRERLRSGPLPPEVAVAVAIEVAAGLEHAHRQGVIHRDVKPENVLIELSAEGEGGERTPLRMKLTDFGIAKLLDAQGVTSTGQVLGSPAHMAPEQIEGRAVDARTDVFALGVLLYEMMVGLLPFPGDHPAQVLRRVLDGEFIAAERQDAKIGAGYSRLISRALARQREDRFASAQEFADALRQELAALGFTKLRPLLEAVMHPDPSFEDELLQRLVERGSQARAEGQIAVAAEYFGRALAYRPGDRQLLRRVSGLARDRELRRIARGVGLVGGAAALGFLLYRQLAPASVAVGSAPARAPVQAAPVPSAGAPGALSPGAAPSDSVPPVAVPPGSRAPAASGLAAAPKGGARDVEGATAKPDAPPSSVRRAASRRPVAGSEGEPGAGIRDVVVRIAGAMGGTLRIDGEQVQWFGDVHHPLTLGPHRFEFVAPDSNCCLSSERTVNVVAGEGPQQVSGEIPFLDAILRVTAEDGQLGQLTCPAFFSGEQRFPAEVRIKMSRATLPGACTLRGEASSAPPQKFEVTLRAGKTEVIPWP